MCGRSDHCRRNEIGAELARISDRSAAHQRRLDGHSVRRQPVANVQRHERFDARVQNATSRPNFDHIGAVGQRRPFARNAGEIDGLQQLHQRHVHATDDSDRYLGADELGVRSNVIPILQLVRIGHRFFSSEFRNISLGEFGDAANSRRQQRNFSLNLAIFWFSSAAIRSPRAVATCRACCGTKKDANECTTTSRKA